MFRRITFWMHLKLLPPNQGFPHLYIFIYLYVFRCVNNPMQGLLFWVDCLMCECEFDSKATDLVTDDVHFHIKENVISTQGSPISTTKLLPRPTAHAWWPMSQKTDGSFFFFSMAGDLQALPWRWTGAITINLLGIPAPHDVTHHGWT